jgi:hypothetical protein
MGEEWMPLDSDPSFAYYRRSTASWCEHQLMVGPAMLWLTTPKLAAIPPVAALVEAARNAEYEITNVLDDSGFDADDPLMPVLSGLRTALRALEGDDA